MYESHQALPPTGPCSWFRSHMRNNVVFTGSGDVLMIAATLGICLNMETNEQRYMSEHDEDIVSLAVHHITKKRNSYLELLLEMLATTPKLSSGKLIP